MLICIFIILLRFKIERQCLKFNLNLNSQNLVYKCGYKLPITEQNLAKKGKDIVKRFWWLLFLTHPVGNSMNCWHFTTNTSKQR